MLNSPQAKSGGALAVSSAVVGIAVYILSRYGIMVPEDVVANMIVLVSAAALWFAHMEPKLSADISTALPTSLVEDLKAFAPVVEKVAPGLTQTVEAVEKEGSTTNA